MVNGESQAVIRRSSIDRWKSREEVGRGNGAGAMLSENEIAQIPRQEFQGLQYLVAGFGWRNWNLVVRR